MRVLTIVFMLFTAQFLNAADIAYVYGDVGNNGSIPSGGNPYDQMRLDDTGNTGCSQFKQLIINQGHTVTEHYDQATTINANFLANYDAIIFGLHQRVLTNQESISLEAWIRLGGNVLFYSDSASGGHYGQVGAQNNVGQTAVNAFTSYFGMEVTVDQANGVRDVKSDLSSSHPILASKELVIVGEGVSPVVVDTRDPDIEVLIPYINSHVLDGKKATVDKLQGITINANFRAFAALAVKSLENGNIIMMFDRQPVWNNGPGASINSGDNKEILGNIVKFMASGFNTPPEKVELDRSNWSLTASRNSAKALNAIDGSGSTRWDTGRKQAPGQKFNIDLGTVQTFDSITLDSTNSPNDFPKAYTVRVSNDGINYTDVTSGSGTYAVTEIALPTQQNARYIQIEQTASTNYYYWSIHELIISKNGSTPTEEVELDRNGWSLSASSNSGKLYNAIDGSDASRWDTGRKQAPGQKFEIDLGAAQTFDSITLDSTNSPNDYPRAFIVRVSNDGVNYTDVLSGTGTYAVTEIELPIQQNARYIQIEQTASTDHFWWSIHELIITKSASTPSVEIELDSSNWSLTASKNAGQAFYAIDDNSSTRWKTGAKQAPGQTFEIDLGTVQTFDNITLDTTDNPNDYPRSYIVRVSNDGVNYTDILTGSGTYAVTEIELPTQQNARYIQIEQTGSTDHNWWSIHELTISRF